MIEPAVVASRVTVYYREVLALQDIDVHVDAGRICGLVGMNGSGKSTLFKVLMGMVTPQHGEVRLCGVESRVARKHAMVAYVPQSEDVDWTFPIRVREVVMTGRYGHLDWLRRPKQADRTAVDEALERVGLEGLGDRQIGELSGGQRKRAFVARAITQNAQLLLLDEPFAGVDSTSEATITALLRSLRDEGRSVLVSSHDLAGLAELCDDAILLNQKLITQGPVDEALRPDNVAAAFGLDARALAMARER
jgi:manganese transport system ATP-binding protein